jgi:hypothetical protein
MTFSKVSSSSSSLESSSSSLETYFRGEDLDFTFFLTLLCHEASMLPFVEVREERLA